MITSRYQGQVGAALVLGGVDSTGPNLFTIAPHGSTDKLPYVTMGSGSLAAMAVFESNWRANMSVRRLASSARSASAYSVYSFVSVLMLFSSSKTRYLPVSSTISDPDPMSTRASSLQTTLRCFEMLRCQTKEFKRNGRMYFQRVRQLGRRRTSRSWFYRRR